MGDGPKHRRKGRALDEASPALSAFANAERLNSAAIGEVKTVQATISLDNVSSAHLPVPSNSFNITLADDMDDAGEQERDNARAAMDKLMWSQDGGAGTRDGSNVPRGFSYTATCAYQAPVSEPDQLDQIASIASRLNAQVVAQEDGDTSALSQGQPDRGYLYLDQALPDELQEFIDTARKRHRRGSRHTARCRHFLERGRPFPAASSPGSSHALPGGLFCKR